MVPLDQWEEPTAEKAESDGGPRMSFLDHLGEFRRRLFRAFLWTVAAMIPALAYQNEVLHFLIGPLEKAMGPLAVLTPAEAFMNKFKAAFVAGIALALPAIAYELWAFVSPGLLPKERRWVVPVVIAATGLFFGGASFCYLVVVPTAVTFFASQGSEFTQSVSVSSAFSFSAKLLLGLGAMFELPLVIFALARMGLISAKFLIDKIGIAIFLIFVAAAVLTPTPDVFTMVVFALPLMGLYVIGIGVAWVFQRRDRS